MSQPGSEVDLVLVHGAMHGAWCWAPTVQHLAPSPRVRNVVAVDLPGHGARRDAKPQDEITRADYVDCIVSEIESRDLRDVVLVGHSLGGVSIPFAAARVPDRIRHLVFLATTNPAAGVSVTETIQAYELAAATRAFDPAHAFCNDLDEETTEWLLSQLGPQPPRLLADPIPDISLPPELPSTYILLERDETLPPAYQREQAKRIGAKQVVTMDCGHSAFAAKPQELAELLIRLAG